MEEKITQVKKLLESRLPPSEAPRALALARTNLEQAWLWARRACELAAQQ